LLVIPQRQEQAEHTSQPHEETEADEVKTLAEICAAVYGEQDQRACTEHIRGLSQKERLNAYREAMEEHGPFVGRERRGPEIQRAALHRTSEAVPERDQGRQ
jgi:hypothetical protein